MATDANLNFAQCIKSTADFGVSHIHNVCTGSVSHLAWGSADWALCIGLLAVGAAMAAMFCGMARDMWRY